MHIQFTIAAFSAATLICGCTTARVFNFQTINFTSSSNPEKTQPVISGLPVKHSKPLNGVSIGFGSGQAGFESISVSADGVVDVIQHTSTYSITYRYLRTNIGEAQAQAFLKHSSCESAASLYQSYSVGISDGVQGFICIESEQAKGFTYLNNYFPHGFEMLWKQATELLVNLNGARWVEIKSDDGFSAYRYARAAVANLRPESNKHRVTEHTDANP